MTHKKDPFLSYHSKPEWTWEQWQWRSTPHSKLQHYWSLTIILFSVISRTLIMGQGVEPLCREAVGVFYSPVDWAEMLKQILIKTLMYLHIQNSNIHVGSFAYIQFWKNFVCQQIPERKSNSKIEIGKLDDTERLWRRWKSISVKMEPVLITTQHRLTVPNITWLLLNKTKLLRRSKIICHSVINKIIC